MSLCFFFAALSFVIYKVESYIYCYDAYECANQAELDPDETTIADCYGDSACSNISSWDTRTTQTADCYGAFACQGTTNDQRGGHCTGVDSCRNTGWDTFNYCWGHQSCSYSTLTKICI